VPTVSVDFLSELQHRYEQISYKSRTHREEDVVYSGSGVWRTLQSTVTLIKALVDRMVNNVTVRLSQRSYRAKLILRFSEYV